MKSSQHNDFNAFTQLNLILKILEWLQGFKALLELLTAPLISIVTTGIGSPLILLAFHSHVSSNTCLPTTVFLLTFSFLDSEI